MKSLGSARADGDSWDLASSVGATATMAAASRALASRGPEPLINDPFAEPLVRAVGHDFFTRLLDGEITSASAASQLSDQTRREQVAVRTRFFDDFLCDATAAGVRQVVILAAGLDARAYRLPWPPGTVLFEVDQPGVVAFKTTTLASLGVGPNADCRAVGVDLREDWPRALHKAFFDSSEPTAWLAEGLLIYLPPDAQDGLLDNLTALSAPGSWLATENVTDMSAFTDERMEPWRGRWRQNGLDVDVADLVWDGPRTPAAQYLTSKGWRITNHSPEELFATNGFQLPRNQAGEALRSHLTYVSARL